MTVFCDNDGCMFSDGCGFCDCDKLSIVGGVCAGSYRSGRNVCDGDVGERLKAENAKLRKLIAEWYPHMKKRVGVDALWQWGHMAVIRELGVEVDK